MIVSVIILEFVHVPIDWFSVWREAEGPWSPKMGKVSYTESADGSMYTFIYNYGDYQSSLIFLRKIRMINFFLFNNKEND